MHGELETATIILAPRATGPIPTWEVRFVWAVAEPSG